LAVKPFAPSADEIIFKVVIRGAEWIETTLAGETNDANQFRAIPFGLSRGPGCPTALRESWV